MTKKYSKVKEFDLKKQGVKLDAKVIRKLRKNKAVTIDKFKKMYGIK